jgi:hypothetical protein
MELAKELGRYLLCPVALDAAWEGTTPAQPLKGHLPQIFRI